MRENKTQGLIDGEPKPLRQVGLRCATCGSLAFILFSPTAAMEPNSNKINCSISVAMVLGLRTETETTLNNQELSEKILNEWLLL
jgi:hypothetical protein